LLPLIDILLLCLFLFPIAVYCTVLGLINRRPQPVVISGSWDFLGVVLATSGFLLFAGPAILSGAFQRSLRELPIDHESGSIGAALGDLWTGWWTIWLVYYLVIVGGALLLVWSRRDTTVVYNIAPQTLEIMLARTAERLGLAMDRQGNRYSFSTRATEAAASTAIAEMPLPVEIVNRPRPDAHSLKIDLEPFPMLSNVSLHWHDGTPRDRADMERELRKSLAELITLENAAGSWLLGIGGFLFLLIMLLTAGFVVLVLTFGRRL
jgi:hypothetical protein